VETLPVCSAHLEVRKAAAVFPESGEDGLVVPLAVGIRISPRAGALNRRPEVR
jgi:hypothetical protein